MLPSVWNALAGSTPTRLCVPSFWSVLAGPTPTCLCGGFWAGGTLQSPPPLVAFLAPRARCVPSSGSCGPVVRGGPSSHGAGGTPPPPSSPPLRARGAQQALVGLSGIRPGNSQGPSISIQHKSLWGSSSSTSRRLPSWTPLRGPFPTALRVGGGGVRPTAPGAYPRRELEPCGS